MLVFPRLTYENLGFLFTWQNIHKAFFFSINKGVQTSEKILKACGYPNSSLVNTATCSKMNQDKHTEEEEQSKQKHTVTPWHAIRKKKSSKVITFWLSHMVDFRSSNKIREKQRESFGTYIQKARQQPQADKVKNIGQWISYTFTMLFHTFRIK